MFCEKCGAQIVDGALFCEECGAKVQNEQPDMEVQKQAQAVPPVMPQVVPPVTPQAVPPVMPQATVPVVPRQPMSKSLKILLIEVAVLAIAVFAFFKIGEKTFAPETLANQYFMAESKGDWNMVFDMMDLPSSAMLTKEMFLKSVEENQLKDITNYKVTERASSKVATDAMLKTFECEYMPTGGTYMNTETIQLVKQQDKKWFLFEEWKVSPSSQLVENFMITIPADAEATLEGITLDELAGKPDSSENGVKKYTLPKAFPGEYELVVKAPYRMDYVETIDISSYNSVYVNNMQMEANILEAVVPQCNDVVEKLYKNALNGVDYATFCEVIDDSIAESFDATYFYEDRMQRLSQREYEEYHEVAIPEIEYSFYNAYTNYESGNLQVEITARFTTNFRGNVIRTDWWTNKTEKEPMENWYQDEYMDIRLELVNGQWKLVQIN